MKKGFTVIEVVIATLVLSILSGGIMLLFQRGNAAFSITLWKQERTKQAEVFWTHFRKHIEEASDLLEIPTDQLGKPHPEVNKKEPKPILVHASPNIVNDKQKILAWNVSHLDFDFTGSGLHESKSNYYYLIKDDRKITLTDNNSKKIAELDDIDSINFIVKPLVNLEERSYTTLSETDTVPADKIVGTLLEISLTMTPPKREMAQGNRIPHNHKFKLNVAFKKTTSINY